MAKKKDGFIIDYNKIVNPNTAPVTPRTEWTKKGDVFEKFTMYNTNYKIIPNLDSIGSTTLIKEYKMPNWNEVLVEIHQDQRQNPQANPLDTVRRKYLNPSNE